MKRKTKGGIFMAKSGNTGEYVKGGITLGTALAVTISWSVNKSILWAIIHGIFSWFYVIYYALVY